LLGTAALPLAGPAQAQEFPQRPVRLIILYGAGNVIDQVGRMLAEALSQRWPQRVVVENVPGADGELGIAAAVRATPAGHTWSSPRWRRWRSRRIFGAVGAQATS
jgi:tripartite-type tricarboxylate transporter receptor subunit TctC